jgi:hypothetical protein
MEENDLLNHIKMSDQGSIQRVILMLQEYSVTNPENSSICLDAVTLLNKIYFARERKESDELYDDFKLCEDRRHNMKASEVVERLLIKLREWKYDCKLVNGSLLINEIELTYNLESENLRLAAFEKNEDGFEKEVLKRKIPLFMSLEAFLVKKKIEELLSQQRKINTAS